MEFCQRVWVPKFRIWLTPLTQVRGEHRTLGILGHVYTTSELQPEDSLPITLPMHPLHSLQLLKTKHGRHLWAVLSTHPAPFLGALIWACLLAPLIASLKQIHYLISKIWHAQRGRVWVGPVSKQHSHTQQYYRHTFNTKTRGWEWKGGRIRSQNHPQGVLYFCIKNKQMESVKLHTVLCLRTRTRLVFILERELCISYNTK